MHNNSQSRKWNLVVNNPHEAGLLQEEIINKLQRFSLEYFCLCDEIAESGTYHTHIFMYSLSPIRFSTIKNRFPTAHIEKAYGTALDNKSYLQKTGKWAETKKAETSVEGTFYEYGNIPTEIEEENPQMSKLIKSLYEGKTTTEIILEMPKLTFKIRDIDLLRQTLLSEKYLKENRMLDVSYLYGASGTGKTRGIFNRHDASEISRVTNYRNGKGVSFDGYNAHDVLVFEEFNSQIPIEEMLNYLDIYPLYLPARYNDKVACYTKIYITSNNPFENQYEDIQRYRPDTWNAWYRRIHNIIEYHSDRSTTIHKGGFNNE